MYTHTQIHCIFYWNKRCSVNNLQIIINILFLYKFKLILTECFCWFLPKLCQHMVVINIFWHPCWLIFLFTVIRETHMKQQRCVLELQRTWWESRFPRAPRRKRPSQSPRTACSSSPLLSTREQIGKHLWPARKKGPWRIEIHSLFNVLIFYQVFYMPIV